MQDIAMASVVAAVVVVRATISQYWIRQRRQRLLYDYGGEEEATALLYGPEKSVRAAGR